MTNALMINHWKHQSIASALHAMDYFVDQKLADRLASEKKRLRRLRLRAHRRGSGAGGRISISFLKAASASLTV